MTTYVAEPLGDGHQVSDFDSGQPELDIWLREFGFHAQAKRRARTFVWHSGDRQVVAFYSLAAHLVLRDEAASRVGRGGPSQLPAVLLARLALDRRLHGRGVGGALLAEALGRIVAATEAIAARLVVVEVIDEAAALFYEHHGFRGMPGSRRLVQKISDVASTLDGP